MCWNTSNNSWHAHEAIFHDILLRPFLLCWIIYLHYIHRLLCGTNAAHCHELVASCHDTGTGSPRWHVSQPVPAVSVQAVGLKAVERCARWVTATDYVQLSVIDGRRRVDSLCRHWFHWLPDRLDAVSSSHLSPLLSVNHLNKIDSVC